MFVRTYACLQNNLVGYILAKTRYLCIHSVVIACSSDRMHLPPLCRSCRGTESVCDCQTLKSETNKQTKQMFAHAGRRCTSADGMQAFQVREKRNIQHRHHHGRDS